MGPATERRRIERMAADYEVFLVNEGRTLSCRSRDVSMFGLGLFSDRELGEGASVDVSIIMPQANANFQGRGRVKHLTSWTGEERPYLVGIEFTEGHERGLPFVQAPDKSYQHSISQSVSIDVDLNACYQSLSNVERFPEWDSGCVSAKVLDRHPDGRPRRVEFVRNMLVMKFRHVDQFDYDDLRRELSWQSVGGDKQLVKNVGGYILKEISGSQTLMTFHADITVAVLPARRIINYFTSIAVRKEMKNFKKMIESEYAKKH